MTKILFLQDIPFEYYGPMQMSAILKQNNHEADVIAWNKSKDLIRDIKKSNPDIVAFSFSSYLHKEVMQRARLIKKELGLPIIFGGPHPTFFPQVIEEDGVDMICIGEGDYVILDVANEFENKKDYTKIKNLWVKKDGKIYKNPVRPLICNLDELPFPDRELYYQRYPFLRDLPVRKIMATRGCPYQCTFCYNQTLMKINKGQGKYVRQRSPDNVIKEIKELRAKYPMKEVRISDDSFTFNKEWLKKLLLKFKKEINIPYTCQGRANELTEDVVKLLKDTGCSSIYFAIETGNEELRNTVLNKNITNEQIINAARFLKKHNIKFGTFNMFGLPTETVKNSIETIKINQKIKPDFLHCSVFQPYPGLEITDFAIKQGLLKKDFNLDDIQLMSGSTILDIKDENEIVNLERFFYASVKFPFILPMIRQLAKLPQNKIYEGVYKVGVLVSRYKATNYSLIDALKLGWEMKKAI